MIDAKRAIQIAREKATHLLNQASSSLEEIERDSYKDREVWSITLSLPRDPNDLTPLARITQPWADLRHYKRFLIDAETGELLAMKVREVALQ